MGGSYVSQQWELFCPVATRQRGDWSERFRIESVFLEEPSEFAPVLPGSVRSLTDISVMRCHQLGQVVPFERLDARFLHGFER